MRDPKAGPADPRVAAYFEGRHRPRQALPQRVGFVAVVDGIVIGYTAGHLTTRYDYQGELQYLFVAPEYRRRGIATALVGRLATWFLEHDATRVCVNADPDSPAARPFYESLGARPFKPEWLGWDDVTRVANDRPRRTI